ncbi:adenosine 5'-monophosphoramidase HINT3-like [Neoarius graeffei]|uniref:adenosine 5'-monophosphoramidase HINT3-like n=1 Tax=Neoarius graeffei TaxID=443677 RepID=UPI00298BF039|nr:adenosine 5'-monophosphoramidase HINT3-like [Neoarius graeffei]
MASSESAAASSESVRKEHNDSYERKCIFCKIVNGEMDTELLHSDEDMSCFRDIKPGAPHHYLVVPKKHVGNCKSLRKEHIPLVEKLVETGKAVLQKNNVTDLSDVRFGFHWPPFNSVTHLHLHVLAPASQISRFMYRLDSYWFITADQLLQRLNSMD